MNESITRAAGGVNGQQLDAAELAALATRLGRRPWQRTTLYRRVARAGAERAHSQSAAMPAA